MNNIVKRVIVSLLLNINSATMPLSNDDLEFHLMQDFYCSLTVYSINLPIEHSTLYFEHVTNDMYIQPKELLWQLK